MPEFGDFEALYYSVNPDEVAPAPGMFGDPNIFDAYEQDIPATGLEIATVGLMGGPGYLDFTRKTLPDYSLPKYDAYVSPQEDLFPGIDTITSRNNVTARPTPIDYAANVPPQSNNPLGGFGEFFSGVGDYLGGLITNIPETPLIKTVTGIPDTPLLKLGAGIGDTAKDAVQSVGGFGAIGSMLPLLLIMMLMKD